MRENMLTQHVANVDVTTHLQILPKQGGKKGQFVNAINCQVLQKSPYLKAYLGVSSFNAHSYDNFA